MIQSAELEERRRASQRHQLRLYGGLELDGVTASVVPESAERSIFNAVVYEDGDVLLDRHDALVRAYADAGVRAWTVWVPAEDEVTAAGLVDRGHRLDGRPMAMACELAGLDLDGPAVGEPVGWGEVAALNGIAYDHPPEEFSRPLARLPEEAVRRLGLPGRGVLFTIEVAGDCVVDLVATHPGHRGRGLGSALLRRALREARGRGCETASLIATAAGRPVYERIGFRALGELHMYERRV